MRSFIAVLFGSSTLGMSWPGAADAAQVSKQTDSMGRDYYLFTPDKIDPGITYWLVVEVHGYGGQGSLGSGVREWADRNDCIGVAPSFPNEGYQLLGKDSDRQLIGIFQKLQNQYKLHDKLFIYGHSGGAQFSHRFALKYPQLVIGCCATSAGTWATGAGYGDLPEMAASLPFAISCGERDTGFAAPGMPMNRITWARRFEEYLGKRHFFYKARYWPDAGHEGDGQGNADLANESFSLGTSGMVGKDRADFDAKTKALDNQVAAGNLGPLMTGGGELLKKMKMRDAKQTADNLAAAGWNAGPPAISTCTQRAQEFVAERMQKLELDVEKAALERIAMIEKEPGSDAFIKLRSLDNTFAGWPRVREAVNAAELQLRTKARL